MCSNELLNFNCLIMIRGLFLNIVWKFQFIKLREVGKWSRVGTEHGSLIRKFRGQMFKDQSPVVGR